MNKGLAFIISGPSGSGKDTLLVELFKKCPQIKFSISSVTRDMREGEKEGEKPSFVLKDSKVEQLVMLLRKHNYIKGIVTPGQLKGEKL